MKTLEERKTEKKIYQKNVYGGDIKIKKWRNKDEKIYEKLIRGIS